MIAEELKETRVVQALSAMEATLLGASTDRGEVTLDLAPDRILDVCRALKADFQFVRLSSITAADWFPMEPRFHLAYHLHSLDRRERLRLKCKVNGDAAEIHTVTSVWRSADWYEREVFDMFGVRFTNHPDLQRILMPDDWVGHPMRKDFPVHGHKYSYQNE